MKPNLYFSKGKGSLCLTLFLVKSGKKERETEIEHTSICWLTPRSRAAVRDALSQSLEPGPHSKSPHGWQGLNYLCRHLLLLGFTLAGSWNQEPEPGLLLDILTCDLDAPVSVLAAKTIALS